MISYLSNAGTSPHVYYFGGNREWERVGSPGEQILQASSSHSKMG